MTAHWPLSSSMRSNYDIDWPVNSLMLSFHDLRGLHLRHLPSTVPCSMIICSVSWRQTWPNHDNLRRLTYRHMIRYISLAQWAYCLHLWPNSPISPKGDKLCFVAELVQQSVSYHGWSWGCRSCKSPPGGHKSSNQAVHVPGNIN